jgi:hypothetical protein
VVVRSKLLPGSSAEDAIVAEFVRAWESADLGRAGDPLTGDVSMSMPPVPFECEGRDAVDRICVMTRCETSVLPSFGLPRSLSSP